MDFGMKTKVQIDAEGHAHPPQKSGIGVDLDWDFIDSCTVKKM
jgi:L-alanine-DL-glutamate epimerase-like enolase superfamily enzyme